MIKSIITAAALAVATSAHAETNCASTGDVYQILDQKFQEQRIFVGATPDGLIEVWGNPNTDTWTMIATAPNGVSCLLGDGVGFEAIIPGDPA